MKRSDQLNEMYVGRNLRALASQDGVKKGFVYLILAVLSQDSEGTKFKLKNLISGNTYVTKLEHKRYNVFGLSQHDRDMLAPKVIDESAKGNATQYTDEMISSTELRKVATSLGIANSSKYVKADLLKMVNERLLQQFENQEAPGKDEGPEEEDQDFSGAEAEFKGFGKEFMTIEVRQDDDLHEQGIAIKGDLSAVEAELVKAQMTVALRSIFAIRAALEATL